MGGGGHKRKGLLQSIRGYVGSLSGQDFILSWDLAVSQSVF